MDYESGDTIDLELSSTGLIFRFICQGNILSKSALPVEDHFASHESCPACGSDDTHHYIHTGFYCATCGIIWKAELGTNCMECGRPLAILSTDVLQCTWCGQVWDLDSVRDACQLNDFGNVDWTIAKGANLQ